jgi:selenocysteine lyase/cysteine desulfurase
LELDRVREDTPGAGVRVHLNNAGAGLMPRPVLEAVSAHLELEASIGGYEAADLRADAVQDVYAAFAELLATSTENVAVTENATASFASVLSAVPFRPGDRILTTRNDYVSNQIQYLSLAGRMGVEVVRAPDSPHGGVDVAAMSDQVRRLRPRLVAVTHVPTNSGLVQDVVGVGEVCRELDIPFLVDACQSVGQMPVSVEKLGCDFLSGTGRKFLRGPRGTGFLYVSDRMLDAGWEPLLPDMRAADWIEAGLYQPSPHARRYENWEFPYALVLGLGSAVRYALDLGLEAIRERAWSLAADLRDALSSIPGVTVIDRGSTLSAIVACTVRGWEPLDLVRALRTRGVNTSAVERTSAVLEFDDLGVSGALRVSPHYYNTRDEIDAFLGELRGLVG